LIIDFRISYPIDLGFEDAPTNKMLSG